MVVVGGIRRLVGELHRDGEAVAVLRTDLAQQLKGLDAGNGRQPLGGSEEVRLLPRSRSVVEIEHDVVADALSVQGRHRGRHYHPFANPSRLPEPGWKSLRWCFTVA